MNTTTKKSSSDEVLKKKIAVLVDPAKTPKPNLQDDEELRLLCRELTGVI